MYEYTDKEQKKSDQIFEVLTQVKELLENNGITYWISYGTLLGAIRENDIIKYDHDFDLCVFAEDREKIMNLNDEAKQKYDLSLKMNNNGYIYNFPKGGPKWTRAKPKQWHVSIKIKRKRKSFGDLFVYQRFDDGILRRYCVEDEIFFLPSMCVPAWYIEELKPLRIRDEMFAAPREPEILLDFHYNDWKTPRRSQRDGGKKEPGYLYYGESTKRDFAKVLESAGLEQTCDVRKLEGKYNDFPEWPRNMKRISWYRYYLEKKWMKKYEKEFFALNYPKKKKK